MIGKDRERLMWLCGQAGIDQDGEQFMVLVAEINALLDAKQTKIECAKEPAESDGQVVPYTRLAKLAS